MDEPKDLDLPIPGPESDRNLDPDVVRKEASNFSNQENQIIENAKVALPNLGEPIVDKESLDYLYHYGDTELLINTDKDGTINRLSILNLHPSLFETEGKTYPFNPNEIESITLARVNSKDLKERTGLDYRLAGLAQQIAKYELWVSRGSSGHADQEYYYFGEKGDVFKVAARGESNKPKIEQLQPHDFELCGLTLHTLNRVIESAQQQS